MRGESAMKGGTADRVGPWRCETTAPSSGQPPRGRFSLRRPVRHWNDSCRSFAPTIERMGTSLSAIFASRGRSSQNWMPSTFVGMGRNLPRTSAGASILRANVSWCAGPAGQVHNDDGLGAEAAAPDLEGRLLLGAEDLRQREAAQPEGADAHEPAAGDSVAVAGPGSFQAQHLTNSTLPQNERGLEDGF